MSWTTAVDDLRNFLSDGPTDKLSAQKKVIIAPNGTITQFKTFEFRRITDFTTATAPLGVYVNGVIATVSADDLSTGYFTLSAAPQDGDMIEATYYIQWFLDAELEVFLKNGSQWLLQGADWTGTPDGLQPACLHYSAADAYQKLALLWARHMSETYRTEDAPDKNRMSLVDQYGKEAERLRAQAKVLRNSYYEKSGQPLAALWGNIPGDVREIVPPT